MENQQATNNKKNLKPLLYTGIAATGIIGANAMAITTISVGAVAGAAVIAIGTVALGAIATTAIVLTPAIVSTAGVLINVLGNKMISVANSLKNETLKSILLNTGLVVEKAGKYMFLSVSIPLHIMIFEMRIWLYKNIQCLYNKIMEIKTVRKIIDFAVEKILKPFFEKVLKPICEYVIEDIAAPILKALFKIALIEQVLGFLFIGSIPLIILTFNAAEKIYRLMQPILNVARGAFSLIEKTIQDALLTISKITKDFLNVFKSNPQISYIPPIISKPPIELPCVPLNV